MDWWKPIGALAVGLLAFTAVGGLVGLLEAIAGDVAALATVALVVVAVLAWIGLGSAPPDRRSTPYWGR